MTAIPASEPGYDANGSLEPAYPVETPAWYVFCHHAGCLEITAVDAPAEPEECPVCGSPLVSINEDDDGEPR